MIKIICFAPLFLFVSFSAMFVCCNNTSSYKGATEPEWSTDFESSAATNLHRRKDGSIGFSIPEEPGGDEYLWFYFKIVNTGESMLRFTVENAARAHQTGRRWNITRPVFSADGKTWIHADKVSYRDISGLVTKLGMKPLFHFQSPITADTLWVAYSYPYTNNDLDAFVTTIKHTEGVSISVMGKSAEGRDITKVEITGDIQNTGKRQSIWIVGREHPGETPQSYFSEGMIGALLNSAAGRQLRRVFDFTFVPMLNVDGVARGYYYHNAAGVNLSTDWVEFESPETRTLRDTLVKDIQEKGVRLLINLHSSNEPTKGHYFLVIPSDNLKPEDAEFQKRIFLAAENRHPQLQSHSPVNLHRRQGITGNALYRDYGLYSFYLETSYNRGADGSTVTQESLREAGAALVAILADVLVSE